MCDKEMRWFMRLTLENSRTGKQGFVMYPCEKYEMLEDLDWCQIPYGSGDYTHKAVSYNGVKADSLQKILTTVIESKEHPPSMKELNYLGEQIQRMSVQMRSRLGQEMEQQPSATIVDAINATHRLLSENKIYDGRSMSDRSVLLDENGPYIQVRLHLPDDSQEQETENGIWVDLPIQEDELKIIAKQLGTDSYHDLEICDIYSIFYRIETDMMSDAYYDLEKVNKLAWAMKEHNVVKELGKYKAILDYEICFDVEEAAVLAGKLDEYEFYQGKTLSEVGILYHDHDPCRQNYEGIAEDLGFEETNYGIVRRIEEQRLEQNAMQLN